jgi:hypothetical protein
VFFHLPHFQLLILYHKEVGWVEQGGFYLRNPTDISSPKFLYLAFGEVGRVQRSPALYECGSLQLEGGSFAKG